MSIETTETDAFAIKFKTPCGEKYWVPVDIARKLERELAAVTEQRDELENKLKKSKSYKNVMKRDNAELRKQKDTELAEAREQRDRLAKVIESASVLIAAKGRHNTMLAYNGLRDAIQSITPKP